MKKLFQATFEQSLNLNNDDVIMGYFEKSVMKSILYRLLGPLAQGLSVLFMYSWFWFALSNTVPSIGIKIICGYFIVYWIVYTLGQLLIYFKQIMMSDLWYRVTAGHYMVIFSLLSFVISILSLNYKHISMALIVLILIIGILSPIYFTRKIYDDTTKVLYNQDENKMKWFDKFYKFIVKYGGIIYFLSIIIKWFFGSNFDQIKGYIYLFSFPFVCILALNMGIHYLFYAVNAYYLMKYSEEYREHYGFTIEEWYGKHSLRAIKERRMKK